jgi:hypothetical protein
MGFFDKILEKIGLKKPEAKAGAEAKGDKVASPVMPKKASGIASGGMASKLSKDDALAGEGKAAVAAMSDVDVVAKLEGLAKGKDLNWKVSIVDLLKLLDLDSSRESREELAKELNAPADVSGDSARLNVWLHKEVLRKIAANGGNIPADLLD